MGGLGELLMKVNPWRQATIAARAERDAALRQLELARKELEEARVELASLQTELSAECARTRFLRTELNLSRHSRGLPSFDEAGL